MDFGQIYGFYGLCIILLQSLQSDDDSLKTNISIWNTSPSWRASLSLELSFFYTCWLVLVRQGGGGEGSEGGGGGWGGGGGGWGRGGGRGHISFSFSSCRAHSSSPSFDETREQTWEEGGDLWPTEVCQPVKAVALLMNSQCNQRSVRGGHRSAVLPQEAASCSLKPVISTRFPFIILKGRFPLLDAWPRAAWEVTGTLTTLTRVHIPSSSWI